MVDKWDKWGQGKAHQADANKTEGIAEEESSDAYRSGPQGQQQDQQQGQQGK